MPIARSQLRGYRHYAGLQAEQVKVAAAIQRQSSELLLSDNIAELGARGVDLAAAPETSTVWVTAPTVNLKSALYF